MISWTWRIHLKLRLSITLTLHRQSGLSNPINSALKYGRTNLWPNLADLHKLNISSKLSWRIKSDFNCRDCSYAIICSTCLIYYIWYPKHVFAFGAIVAQLRDFSNILSLLLQRNDCYRSNITAMSWYTMRLFYQEACYAQRFDRQEEIRKARSLNWMLPRRNPQRRCSQLKPAIQNSLNARTCYCHANNMVTAAIGSLLSFST